MEDLIEKALSNFMYGLQRELYDDVDIESIYEKDIENYIAREIGSLNGRVEVTQQWRSSRNSIPDIRIDDENSVALIEVKFYIIRFNRDPKGNVLSRKGGAGSTNQSEFHRSCSNLIQISDREIGKDTDRFVVLIYQVFFNENRLTMNFERYFSREGYIVDQFNMEDYKIVARLISLQK